VRTLPDIPFDIRLRLYTPEGVKGRILTATEISHTTNWDAVGGLTFTVTQATAGRLAAPIVVGVEYQTASGWKRPRNDLFIVPEEDGDSSDAAGTVQFTAQPYIPWLMAHARLANSSAAKDGNRTWYESGNKKASAGYTILGMWNEAKARGWAPFLTVDFTQTNDSNGQVWLAADKAIQSYAVGSDMASALLSVADRADWWTEGVKLRMVRRNNTAATNKRLGGPGFTRAPLRADYSNVFTHLTVIPEEGSWIELDNPGSDTRFGRLEAVLTLSGVSDTETAEGIGEARLASGRSIAQERSYEWQPYGELPVPFVDFQVGDTARCRTRDGWASLQVVGLVVSKRDGVVLCTAYAGEKVKTRAAKNQGVISSVTIGAITGGSGKNVTPSTTPAKPKPGAPGNLHVIANVGTWGKDGNARSQVAIGWDAVTTASDGSLIDADMYEVWSRNPPAARGRDTATESTNATITSWEPGIDRLVSARVRSAAGVWGPFSDEILVTPAYPVEITPAVPTGLHIVSNTGYFTPAGIARSQVVLGWDAVTESTLGEGITIARYDVFERVTGAALPVTSASDVQAMVERTPDLTAHYSVRAVSIRGDVSDLSTEITVTFATPTVALAKPSKPTLVTALGTVAGVWDGKLDGAAPVDGFRRIVALSRENGGAWTESASYATEAGTVAQVHGAVGATIDMVFVAEDTLGRRSTQSDISSIVVQGVTGPDLEANSVTTNALEAGSVTVDKLEAGIGGQLDLSASESIVLVAGAAQNALDAANAKSDLYFQDTEPGVLAQRGGTLWINTSNGANTPTRWAGDGAPNASTSSVVVTGVVVTNTILDPSFELAAPEGGELITEWSAEGVSALRVTDSVTFPNAVVGTAMVVARDADQTMSSGGDSVTSEAEGDVLALSVSGDVTLGAGDWDLLTIVEGDYSGQPFSGDSTDAWWGDGDWVPVTDQVAADALVAAGVASDAASAAQLLAEGAADDAAAALQGVQQMSLVVRITAENVSFTRPGSTSSVEIDEDSVDIKNGTQVGASLTAGQLTVPQIVVEGGQIGSHSVSVEAGQTIFRSV